MPTTLSEPATNVRAVVKWDEPCAVPFIEPDQTSSVVFRFRIAYFAVLPFAFNEDVPIEVKASQSVLPLALKSAVCDKIREVALDRYGDSQMANSDIIFPDLTRGT